MKKNKYYTFIVSDNSSSYLKKIHIKSRTLKIFSGLFLLLMGGSLFLISDYLHIAANQYQTQKAIQEKEELKKKFYVVENKLDTLNREFIQLRDFNRKIRTITSVSVNHSDHLQKQYGKISSDSNLLALATPSLSKRNPASFPENNQKDQKVFAKEPASYTELLIQMDKLTEKAKLVKQNAWDNYSNLLREKEILSRRPSILPVNGWISSPFGYRNETFYADHDLRFHRGLDIAANIGSPVMAAASGQVTYAGYDDTGYGWLLIIDHGYNVKTFYAHMSKIKPEAQFGKYVKRGQIIGEVGNTGKSTGPHLHYEIHLLGMPVNPENYISSEDSAVAYIGGKEVSSFH